MIPLPVSPAGSASLTWLPFQPKKLNPIVGSSPFRNDGDRLSGFFCNKTVSHTISAAKGNYSVFTL